MFALQFDLATAVNVAIGCVIGTAVTLVVGWWSTRQLRAPLMTNLKAVGALATWLESADRNGAITFTYTDDGAVSGVRVGISGTSPGGSSDHGVTGGQEP